MLKFLACVVLMLHPFETFAVEHSLPNEYIMQIEPGVEASETFAAIPSAKIIRKYIIGALEFALIKTDNSFNYANFIEENDIKLVPNMIVHGSGNSGSRECYRQHSARVYYGLSRISSVDLPQDWNDAYYMSDDTGKCVTIYVMDSGVNIHHETFGERAHYGFVASGLQSEGPEDLSGHGTHVSGLAGGTVHGTAKHANIISVKVLGSNNLGTIDWLLEGFEWIAEHVTKAEAHNVTSVINLSLGIIDPSGAMDFLDDIISAIPAVAVAAAGDDQGDACDYAPARFTSVITVAATTNNDRFPFYTNVGRCVDILAPGHRILSASHQDNSSQRLESGTSMSTGFVSGVVARHLQNLEQQQVSTATMKSLLQATASVNKTNADVFDTLNLLLHANCTSDDLVVDQIPDWSTAQCFPYLTTQTTEATTETPSRGIRNIGGKYMIGIVIGFGALIGIGYPTPCAVV